MRLTLFVVIALTLSNLILFFLYSRVSWSAPQDWADLGQTFVRWEIFAFFITFGLSLTMGREERVMKLWWVFAMISFIPLILLSFALGYGDMMVSCTACASGNKLIEADDRMYFSIVTFTTLGYGDIQPPSTHKMFAAAQAVLGFIFVPIIIAEACYWSYWDQKEVHSQ